MTDKIINGIDVSECKHINCEPYAEPYCENNDGEDLDCQSYPNCYYKQLKRKEQECEWYKIVFEETYAFCKELKKDKFHLSVQINTYKQALNEIEEFCLVYRENPVEGTAYDKILKIINKTKEQ